MESFYYIQEIQTKRTRYICSKRKSSFDVATSIVPSYLLKWNGCPKAVQILIEVTCRNGRWIGSAILRIIYILIIPLTAFINSHPMINIDDSRQYLFVFSLCSRWFSNNEHCLCVCSCIENYLPIGCFQQFYS